jgi:hypothetical protein
VPVSRASFSTAYRRAPRPYRATSSNFLPPQPSPALAWQPWPQGRDVRVVRTVVGPAWPLRERPRRQASLPVHVSGQPHPGPGTQVDLDLHLGHVSSWCGSGSASGSPHRIRSTRSARLARLASRVHTTYTPIPHLMTIFSTIRVMVPAVMTESGKLAKTDIAVASSRGVDPTMLGSIRWDKPQKFASKRPDYRSSIRQYTSRAVRAWTQRSGDTSSRVPGPRAGIELKNELSRVRSPRAGPMHTITYTAARQLNLRPQMAQPPPSRRPDRLKGRDSQIKPEPRYAGGRLSPRPSLREVPTS